MRIDSSTRTLCVYNGVINANITGVYSATRCLTSTFTKNKDEIDLKYLLGQKKAIIYIFPDKIIYPWDITKNSLEDGISIVPSKPLPGVSTPYQYSKTIEVFNNNESNVILFGINNLLYGFRVTQPEIKAWASFSNDGYDTVGFQTLAMCQNSVSTSTSKKFIGMLSQYN